MVTRRELLGRALGASALLSAAPLVAACAPQGGSAPSTAPTTAATTLATAVPSAAATLAPPETTSIGLAADACDSAMYGAERYLRDEGFTDIQITDMPTPAAITAGKAQIGRGFAIGFFNAVQVGDPKIVALGGLHPGCSEIWAQPGIASVKDLKGRTVVVTAKSLANTAYGYMAMVLQQAGVDPKDVNFVIPAGADPTKLFFDGKNDAVFVATTAAAAIKTNPANKGKMIHSQVMEQPWASTNCCFIVVSEPWYRANPIAARRALRAIYRTADALPADRADAAKAAADRGLFGGSAGLANLREAANMVPLDWRASDPEKAIRFYAPLLSAVGLLKTSTDDLLKTLDLTIFKQLATELKR